MVVSKRTACYRVVAYTILCDYFTVYFGVVLTIKNSPLVTVLMLGYRIKTLINSSQHHHPMC